jgi:hypothetical protein
MAGRRLSDLDERFVHQLPDLLTQVERHHPHWRESYFFDLHRPDASGDVVFFTYASYPAREILDSIQMGKVGGVPIIGRIERPYGDDPHTTSMPGATVDIVKPFEEIRLKADEAHGAAISLDVTFQARTQPYALRRGTMRAGDDIVWDQSHILQSGVYTGSYAVGGRSYDVDGWIGQRDHSWGIREHNRCPLWMWLQLQFDDGFLGVWHWELANGARIYTDGCWAATDRSDPVPVVDFRHDLRWLAADGSDAVYGTNGDEATGLAGHCTFVLQDGRTVDVDATGRFDRPYEPFARGGLSQMQVRTNDGRTGSAIYEITGSRHHRYFPDTIVPGVLPS